MSNAQRAEGSKVKGSYTGGFLQLCLYLLMTSPNFSGVPCTTGDRHPRSSPNPCQHQPRGELSDSRGGRYNQHGENIRSLFSFQVLIASFHPGLLSARRGRTKRQELDGLGGKQLGVREDRASCLYYRIPLKVSKQCLALCANSLQVCAQIVSR